MLCCHGKSPFPLQSIFPLLGLLAHTLLPAHSHVCNWCSFGYYTCGNGDSCRHQALLLQWCISTYHRQYQWGSAVATSFSASSSLSVLSNPTWSCLSPVYRILILSFDKDNDSKTIGFVASSLERLILTLRTVSNDSQLTSLTYN